MNASEVNYQYELTKPSDPEPKVTEAELAKDFTEYRQWLQGAFSFLPYAELEDLQRNEQARYEAAFKSMKRPECLYCGK